MKPIVTFPKGTLTTKDKLALCRAGYVPIETDAPLTVSIPIPSIISAEDFGRCAVRAINLSGDDYVKRQFIAQLGKAIDPPKEAA